jgi:uncharacterized phage infection (PIP) family protein YhgE
MAGGTRIVAFDPASEDAPGEEILLTEEYADPGASTSEWAQDDEPVPGPQRDWLLPALAGTALIAWSGFFAWAVFDRVIAGVAPEQVIGLIRDWAVPVLLVAVAALVVLRNSRREALRFGDAARALADESVRLETRLSVVNRELSLAREFIAAQSRDLETLGRLAADRLSTEADRLQGLIRDNHARVEGIGTVSAAALDNMEKLRGQLPVIASSAKDVTNNIGNAGRTAHSQLQDMISGFKRLNEFGQASERQILLLRNLVEETIAEFTRQSEQFGEIAAHRFAAFHETGAEFRTQLETQEVEALTSIRSRASAMAGELEVTRQLLDANEAESLTSMRARLTALRDEGAALARAFREGESRALDGWQTGIARMKEELQSALIALSECEADAAEASHARVDAITEELMRLERQASERAASFAEETEKRRADVTSAEEAFLQRMQDSLAVFDKAAAARRTRHGEIEDEAESRLRARFATLDSALADRRGQHEKLDQLTSERLQERFAAFDVEMAQRRAQLEAHGAAMTSETENLAERLTELEQRIAGITAHGGEAEATIATGLQMLADRLAASRTALAGTDTTIAALTESSVRLLELIQASVKHGSEDLPAALVRGEARLSEIETRMAALREAASETDARGENLAETIGRADENLRRTYADLATLQAGIDAGSGAHGAALADLRQELDGIAARSANLAEESRAQLGSALAELSRSTEGALARFGESGAAAVSALARQLGSESSAAIEDAMRASTAEATGKLEQATATAAAAGREAAIQLRDQLTKVNELAANLESRVAHARQRAEEQVDSDFTRRVALITESLNSNAIDIAKALSTDVSDTAWTAYLRGDRGIFTRRAVTLIENTEAKAIVQIYERDREFHEHVSRYIHDFEAMLRQVLSARDGQALGVTLLSSDMGKLYVALAQAIERLRN